MNFANGLTFLSLVVGITTILLELLVWQYIVDFVKERTKEIGTRRALGATPSELSSDNIGIYVLTTLAGVIGIYLDLLFPAWY